MDYPTPLTFNEGAGSTVRDPDKNSPLATPIRPDLIPGLLLVRALGAGSSATVYLARTANGDVAVKILAPHYVNHPEVLTRWEREADTLIRIRHPHVVQGIRRGVAEGRPFVVMEYVQGESLSAQLRREGPLSEEDTFQVARSMLSALSAAHALGVIHRDIKPSNIIRSTAGPCKLTDFGLARHLDDASLTMQGAILGTPAYVSPEQARGDQNLDPRSDIYSLGITLIHLATGDVPFASLNTSLLLTRKVTEDVPDVRRMRKELSPFFAFFVAALSQRDRTRRPANAQAALDLLEKIFSGDFASLDHSEGMASTSSDDARRVINRTAIPVGDPMLQTVVTDRDLKSAPQVYSDGDVLFYEDDRSRDAYVLLDGAFEVLKAGRQVAVIDKAGTFIGEMSTLRNAPRSATVRALRTSTVLRITEDEFHAFLRRHPEMTYRLATVLAERLDDTNRRLTEGQAKLARLQRHIESLAAEFNG